MFFPRNGWRKAILRMVVALLVPFATSATDNMHQARAQSEQIPAVELVLAVDVSGSVSADRFELQRQGYAAAFRDVRVIRAITSHGRAAQHGGGVAVTMTQWTGPALQEQVVPWTHIDSDAASRRFADAVASAPRALFSGGTSISGAIDHAVRLLTARSSQANAPSTQGAHAVRRVIDVSGDGANNRGRPAAMARDDAVAAGIVVNGLPILVLEPNLDAHYRDNVIGGPGAFVVPARNYETFAEAIVRKLVLEIAGNAPSDATLATPGRIR